MRNSEEAEAKRTIRENLLDASEKRWPSQIDADGDTTERSHPSHNWKSAVLPFLFPALGGLLFGFDSGSTSGAIIALKDPLLSGTNWYDLNPTETGMIVSGSLVGALVGSMVAFFVSDTFGRKKELLLASSCYVIGGVLMALCPSLSLLILGRFIYGIGIGLAMHGSSLYIGETSPAHIRGILVSLEEVFTVLGILLGYLSGLCLTGSQGGWRLTWGSTLPLSITMFVGMIPLPHSPRWLSLQASRSSGHIAADFRERAAEAAARLWGKGAGTVEEPEVEEGVDEGAGDATVQAVGSVWWDLFEGPSVKALVIGIGMVFFQQVSGQPSVLYYAGTILEEAGFTSVWMANLVAVSIGVVKLVLTGLAVLLVDRWGRRPLLLIGVSGMTVSLLMLASCYLEGGFIPMSAAVFPLLLFVGFYQVSFGPISWILVSEIFPLRVRGRALSVTTFVNFGTNAVVAFLLPSFQDALGQGGTFVMFSVLAALAVAFIFWKVPETKGLSLEEIEDRLVHF